MKLLTKENAIESQNKVYSDPGKWRHSTVTPLSKRLRIAARYAGIIELCRPQQDRKAADGEMDILDVGCGVGLLSVVLASFGRVLAFDYCEEAVGAARRLFGNRGNVRFFKGDGENPEKLEELKGKKFDVIILREFHPITRNIEGKRRTIDIVRAYYGLLDYNGVMLIEHSLPVLMWFKDEKILQVSAILKEFRTLRAATYSLAAVLSILSGLGQRWPMKTVFKAAGLILPFESLLCCIANRNMSKTFVIRKPEGVKACI